jgi:hypothetical protein
MLGSNSRGLLDLEHGKMRRWVSKKMGSEGANNSVTGNKCTGFLSWGNPQRGLFIGVVRGLVTMFEQPPNHPIYTECTVTWALHSFHIPDYFTQSLSHGDMCPLRSGLRPSCFPNLRLVEASAPVVEPPTQRRALSPRTPDASIWILCLSSCQQS